jgi:hypothetical protein
MNLPEPVQPKKANNITWIIIVVVVLLLCCILAAALGGLYYYLKQNGRLPSFPPGSVPSPAATEVPPVIFGPLVIEPANPTSSNYPTLQELIPNWSAATTPGSQTWSVTVSPNKPVLVFFGWCTTTAEILDQNYQHITYKLIVDGQQVDVKGLYLWNDQETDRICQTYVGLIRQWTWTKHTLVTTMTFNQKVNDGWDDYPAGDYTDVYNITVSP